MPFTTKLTRVDSSGSTSSPFADVTNGQEIECFIALSLSLVALLICDRAFHITLFRFIMVGRAGIEPALAAV